MVGYELLSRVILAWSVGALPLGGVRFGLNCPIISSIYGFLCYICACCEGKWSFFLPYLAAMRNIDAFSLTFYLLHIHALTVYATYLSTYE